MPWEYAIFDSRLYRFELGTLYETLDDATKKEFERLAEAGNPIAVRKWVYGILKKRDIGAVRDISLYDISVEKNLLDLYEENIEEEYPDNESRQLVISAFPRSGNRHFVPGSSLKGALRTSLLWALQNGSERDKELAKEIDRCGDTDVSFRALSVRDAILKEDAVVAGALKRNMEQFFEYLPKGSVFEFEISADTILDEKRRVDFSKENILRTGRAFSKSKLSDYIAQLDIFSDYLRAKETRVKADDNKLDQIARTKSFFQGLVNDLGTSEDVFFLPLGFGVGYWHKITIKPEMHPNVRSIAHYANLPSWISRTWWHGSRSPVVGFLRCTIR